MGGESPCAAGGKAVWSPAPGVSALSPGLPARPPQPPQTDPSVGLRQSRPSLKASRLALGPHVFLPLWARCGARPGPAPPPPGPASADLLPVALPPRFLLVHPGPDEGPDGFPRTDQELGRGQPGPQLQVALALV